MKITISGTFIGWLILLCYLGGGFFTFGWVYNHSPVCGERFCGGDREIGSGIAAGIWPFYWGGVIAINLTK